MQQVSSVANATSQASPSPQPRLVRAAHEFESQMMKELLKPMIGKGALIGGADDSDDGSNAALGEFASEALGKALSQGGGFGIAKSLIHDLSHSGNRHQTGTVIGIPPANTVISVSKSLK
jgi:Rod binding domain-containing protein